MGIAASTDSKTEISEPGSQNSHVPSENPGDSSPSAELGDSDPNADSKESAEDEQGEEEEEEGECGFCLFMKGGGCKDSFTAWEVCVEEAEKNKEDIVTKCMEVTSALKKCMDEHSDYYHPILAAEKDAEERVKKEMEAEKKSEEEVVAAKQAEAVTVKA